MLNAHLAELEREFRKQWHGYLPTSYGTFLEQVAPEDQAALLARLLAVELEYSYQPPNSLYDPDCYRDDDERVQPRVMLFLHQFPQLRQHRELIIQLVMLEFALRLRFDTKTPNYDSYLEICPHEKERIGNMMQVMEEKLYRLGNPRNEPGASSKDDTTVDEGASAKIISLAQLPCSLGYFLLTEVIGQGGMGTVYSAVDLRSAAHVAVKIIHRADSWSVYRFIEEFTWLSTLHHPNVVKLYDTFSEGDMRYFSMEVVEGKSIRDWFREASDPDRWGQLRRVLSQAALAVAFLHDHDVIHRDIKSSNLMITGRGRAVLLDLGLASRLHDDQANMRPLDGQQVVGTLHYLAPESLCGGEPDFASDWYSFGVMMYETMTGHFPPVLIDKRASLESGQRFRLDYGASQAQLCECPRELAGLCLEMLRIDPAERPSAADIIRRLGSDVGQPIPFAVSDADFVGRQSGIAMLDRGLSAARAGMAVLRSIRGESGMGKTALLNRWIKQSGCTSDFLRLSLRCHSQDHTPLRALNLLVQELVTNLAQQPYGLWLDLARGGGEEVVFTFPQMERLGGDVAWPVPVRTADSMEGVARRAAGLHALLGWLKGLSLRRPLLITIDDAHWADQESGRILSHLLRPDSQFRGMIVLVDQGDQVASPLRSGLCEQELDASVDQETYEIPPLTREECTRLLQCWSGRLKLRLSEQVANDILSRSGGSPFLLQELLRSYVNYIVRHRLSDETWLSSWRQDVGVLHNRFSMLPPTTEKVLQFLAVSTQPLGIHQLQTASRILPGQLMAELNHLSGQGWIRWNGTTLDSELEISHERFREVVLKSMMEDRLQRRHYRLARMLSSEVPPPWRRIAHHYSEARQFREAAACYMEGARAAAKRLSFGEALWMLERAFHPQAQRTEAEARDAQRLKADCLAGHGNALAAAEAYEQLAISAGDDLPLMQCLAGEQWIRAGRLSAGLENLRNVLKQLGVLAESESMVARGQRFWQLLRLRWAIPSPVQAPSARSPLTEIEQCLNRMSLPLTFLAGRLGQRLVARMFLLTLERGNSQERALAMSRWALLLSNSGKRHRQGLKWLRSARRLSRHQHGPNARASFHVGLFLWHSLHGRFSTALRYAQRAESLAASRYAADTWETGFMCWVSLSHLWYTGQLRQLCEKTGQYRQHAAQRTDTMWTYWMHVNAAHLADLVVDDVASGRQALDRAESVLNDDLFEMPHVILWVSRVRQLLYEGQCQAAYTCLLESWSKLSQSSVMGVPFYNWLVRYLRIICHLACWADAPAANRWHLEGAQTQLGCLSRFQQPTFSIYANALRLVIDAARGRPAADNHWQQAIGQARGHRLGLLEVALQWHLSIWHPSSADQGQATHAAQGRLIAEGCQSPERLMKVILPLPTHAPF